MSPSRRPPQAVAMASVLALVGLALLGSGLWIPAKARLAQHLIARAWERGLGGEARPRPWPWADTWPVARLVRGGREDAALFVLAGASGQSLAFGPAHVEASAAPGTADNVVFAGHRDTHFAFLRDLAPGELLVVETRTRTTRYRVEAREIVHESRVELLERTGRPELTLITCHPFDAIVPGGPMRFVVHASAIEDDPIWTMPVGAAPRAYRSAGSRR